MASTGAFGVSKHAENPIHWDVHVGGRRAFKDVKNRSNAERLAAKHASQHAEHASKHYVELIEVDGGRSKVIARWRHGEREL